MPTVNIYNLAGEVVGDMELSERVFGAPLNSALLHQAIMVHEANQRAGRAESKTRSQVRGGGRKPWRQKGTGRARAGTTRAPHWRHGGVAFGPHARDFTMRFPRKMRRASIRQALSAKFRDQELMVVDSLHLEGPRTREFIQALDRLELGRNVLVITRQPDDALKLSSRNVSGVHTITADSLNAYSLLKYHRLLMDRSAVEAVEGVFNS